MRHREDGRPVMGRWRVFLDFDGTIAVNDVGDLLFDTFGRPEWRETNRAWERGEVTTRECLARESRFLQTDPARLEALCDAQALDPYFAPFMEDCRARAVPVTVLSDGFDFYVERMLRGRGFPDLPYFANRLVYESDGGWHAEFPHANPACRLCASCKGGHIGRLRRRGETVVYAGDGLSDRCAVPHADVLFAKNALLAWCRGRGITCHAFRDFQDVRTTLDGLVRHSSAA